MNFDFDALRNLVTEKLTQQSPTDRITGVEVREVDIAIINTLEYLISSAAPHMLEGEITTTDGVFNLNTGLYEGTTTFSLAAFEIDYSRISIWFDGSVKVKPTLDSVNKTVTFTQAPDANNNVTFNYYPQ